MSKSKRGQGRGVDNVSGHLEGGGRDIGCTVPSIGAAMNAIGGGMGWR